MTKSVEEMDFGELELQCGQSMLEIARRLQAHKKPFLLRKVQDACILMKEVSMSLESERQ